MTGPLTTFVSSVTYAPHAAPTAVVFGNMLTEQSCYSARDVLTIRRFGAGAQTNCAASGGDLLRLAFAYGTATTDNGNLTSQTITAPSFSQTQYYGYDGVNRLKAASEGAPLVSGTTCPTTTSWCQEYGYEAFGNRWVSFSNQTLHMATPTSASNFNAATNRLTGAGITYDNAGNLTTHPFITPGAGGGMVYNASNKMTQFTATGVSVSYRYDAQQRRVRQDSGGQTTIWVYDAHGQLAAEYATNLTMVQGVYYRTTDHLGSTRVVTNQSAAVVQRRDFFPFGESIPANSTRGNRQAVTDGGQSTYSTNSGVKQQFTGQEHDQETELDYFRARNYSASLGRFLSVDPDSAGAKNARPQSWNAFSYVENQPCTLRDPTGRQAEGPWFPTAPFFWDALQFYWILQTDATQDTISFLDPIPPEQRAHDYAMSVAADVARGAINDCAGLARFTSIWNNEVSPGESLDTFIKGFNVLIPAGSVNGSLIDLIKPSGLYGADNWQRFSGRVGYRQEYGDFRGGQSQSHHFAFYLILGYYAGEQYGELILRFLEVNRDDPGDIPLGLKALGYGHRLRQGSMMRSQLPSRISDELCDQNIQ